MSKGEYKRNLLLKVEDESQTFIAELSQYWGNEQWMKNEKTRFGFIVQIVEEKQEQRYMRIQFS